MNPIKNVRPGAFGTLEGDVFFRLFNTNVRCMIEDAASIDYAGICGEYLDAMSEKLVEHLCEASIRYCNDFLDRIGEEQKVFIQPRDVLSLITPVVLIIPDPQNDNEPIIHLELNCQWEEEHGMEWVTRGDEAIYVGAFNGEDPWAVYSQKEDGNYA